MKHSKTIKIAIHDRPGSFSDRWIEYIEEQRIPYKRVNCYDSDIIKQLESCDVLLWHWHHADPKAILFARQLIYSLENMGIKVFPNRHSCWHFDDKVGQKYLLESIKAPLIPTYIFFDVKEAIDWIEKTDFPIVFKLRCGAGSENVRLVKNQTEAKKLCKRAFGRGFNVTPGYFSDFSAKIQKTANKKNYLEKIKRLPISLLNIYVNNRMRSPEKGYIYFQEFIPGINFDTRVTVIGNRAFAFRRMVRNNDFRASGSGKIDYDQIHINLECIKIAFDIAQKLQSQSIAFDFIAWKDSKPLIIEVSYCYVPSAVKDCCGYWDKDMQWHKGSIWPQDAIVEDILMI